MNIKNNTDFDIAIIGGGVAGTIAAIALAKFYNVVLIDKLEKPVERIGECLAPAARRILRQLDLLSDLEKTNAISAEKIYQRNIGTQSYWGTEQLHIVDHLRNPDGFAWHLNRQAFEIYLREKAIERDVTCFWGYKLEKAHFENSYWYLTITSNKSIEVAQNQSLKVKFVIDASGRQSDFARQLGVKRTHFDKLIACWATVNNHQQNKMSTISASEIGWWYSASLPNQKRVITLQTDSDLVHTAVLKNPTQFFELLKSNQQMMELLGNNKGKIKLHKTVAANSTRLNKVVGKQWLAMGDAAMSFDPLSSQGMFNAMANAIQTTELLIEFDVINQSDAGKTANFESIYQNQIDRVWSHYIHHKKVFYGQEMRWKEAAFWKRRH